jgi:hypothetical protein
LLRKASALTIPTGHPRLTLAIFEFELAWAPHLLTMDYTYRERHGEAIYRFKDGMLFRPACGIPSRVASIR